LHNVIFDNTGYSLLGFTEINEKLFAILKGFLNFNGFEKTRRQDYYNGEFGLALEDIHDENVLARHYPKPFSPLWRLAASLSVHSGE